MNGGLSIDLAGAGWDGGGMDVRTTNGGVTLSIPENYSAHLETGTVNGGLKTDFSNHIAGRGQTRVVARPRRRRPDHSRRYDQRRRFDQT